VPLILVWPKHIAPSVQTANVQLLDVYATVLDLVGAKADPTAPSSSFAAALRGETLPDRIAYGESLYPMLGYGWAPLRYLIQGDLKYIEAPRAELYDRRVDPGETDNKLDKEPRAAELRASLRDLVSRTDIHPPEAPELDAEAQAKLRALGYVGGAAASASTNTSPSGRDPKDMVDIYVGHDRAIVMIKQRRYQDAATLLESLLQRSPESLALYEELGTAYLSLNRLDDALRAYETSLRQVSDDPDRMWGYAEVLRRLGRTDEAISRFERAIARWPSLGEAYLGLSLCYGSRADYAKAYEPARKYAELTPGSKLALGNLANFALGVHKYDDAVETATKLIALDRHWAEGHYVRWEALRAAHKPAEAIAALRDSRESLPSDWLLTCSLAWMLSVTPPAKGSEAATGDEAVRLAQTCVKLNPKHPRSFDVLGAAHAARGSYADAVKAARQALALAAGPQATQARDAIQARIALYDAGQPFRE
jgi:tetratricopeptide (TPR) repeat protein